MISNAARLAHRDSGILGEQRPAFSVMDATVGENLVFLPGFWPALSLARPRTRKLKITNGPGAAD
jgi:hypothetical protein